MGRPKRATPVHKLMLYVPIELKERLDALLYDHDKGRVPKNSYNNYIVGMMARELRSNENAVLDLQEIANGGTE